MKTFVEENYVTEDKIKPSSRLFLFNNRLVFIIMQLNFEKTFCLKVHFNRKMVEGILEVQLNLINYNAP